MSAAEIAERAAAGWRARIAERLCGIGGIEADIEDDGIVVRGRRLRARWLRDARLRWLGGWM